MRLEEGTVTDRWYQSCISLVKSRFETDYLSQFDITDITVHRVLRIHNRFQRNRFEEKVEQHLDMSKPGFKKNFEYLFISMDPRHKDQFYQLVEEGYCSTNEKLGQGKVPYEGLHNTLLGSDLFRLNYHREQFKAKGQVHHSKLKIENKVPTGYLLLCKVVLMNLKQDANHPSFDMNKPTSQIFKEAPVKLQPSENSEVIVTYRESKIKSGKLDHKLYFIHDNNLILPEYLVEFDYEHAAINRSVCHIGDTLLTLHNRDLAFVSPNDDKQQDQKVDFMFKSKIEEIQLKYADPKYKNSELQSIQFFSLEEYYKSGMDHLKIPILNYLTYFENSIVDMEPYRSKTGVLEVYKKEHHEVVSISTEHEAASIEYLSMRLHSLSSFPLPFKFDKIRELDLSCNKLTTLSFVGQMPMLEILLMPDNLVESIDPVIGQASHLKKLNLSFNRMKDINQLKQLKACPALLYLSLRGNPFCTLFPKYQEITLSTVAGLAELDDQGIAALRKNTNQQKPCQFTEALIQEVLARPECSNTMSVSASGMNIVGISLALPLLDIRIVDLSNNGLTKLDGIQFLKNLTELNAENNQLVDITNVGHLSELRKLELGSNLISNIGVCLAGLKNLTLLSIENNKLTTLSCFSELENLLELYVGENLIDDLKEIRNLSNLKKLLVMDLWGNPLCKDKEFRLFCIFHVKDLKVLDGYPIQPKEIEDSKQAYTGKLSDELLAERLQGKNLDSLISMDLSYCSLRDFDNIFNNKKFPKIAEINVTGNFFTTLKCFGYLPTLRALNMTDNRLTSFEPIADPKLKIGLNGLPNIEVLQVSKNKLQSLDSIKGFPLQRLVSLKAAGNLIKKISSITQLENLRDLDLSGNRIKTIESNSFDQWMKLEYLCLDENFIKSFNNLYLLPKLRSLFIRYNKVSDFCELEGLGNIQTLVELDLNSNPLSRKYGYRLLLLQKIPQLHILDGMVIPCNKPLSPEQRERLDLLAEREQMAALKPQQPPKQAQNQPANGRQVRMSNINFEDIMPQDRYR